MLTVVDGENRYVPVLPPWSTAVDHEAVEAEVASVR